MKILVLCLPGLGDTLMFTPALSLLRKQFPDAIITALVMYRSSYDLLETNPNLDRCYQVARECGALGGRITGAGGGGLLMLYCPHEQQKTVIEGLGALGVEHWPLLLEDEGVQLMQLMPWTRQQVLPTPAWSQPALATQGTITAARTR